MPRQALGPFCLVAALVAAGCGGNEDAEPAITASPTTTVTTTTTMPAEIPETSAPAPSAGRGAELPTNRTEVAGAVWDGRIVVLGGLTSAGHASARVDVYDPVDDEWSALPDLPEGLHHTAVAVLGDRLYVVGGYAIDDGRWVPRAEVWTLGSGDDAWRPGPSLTIPRGALAVASTGERLVAIGGAGSPGSLTATEFLQSDATAWVTGPEMAHRREHLAAAAVGDEVYAIAGRTGTLDTNTTAVEVLRDGEWHPVPALNHSRSGIGAVNADGVPCVTGGEEFGGTIGSVECLLDEAWRIVATLEVPRHGLAVTWLDGRLHVISGGRIPGLTVSGVHEILPLSLP